MDEVHSSAISFYLFIYFLCFLCSCMILIPCHFLSLHEILSGCISGEGCYYLEGSEQKPLDCQNGEMNFNHEIIFVLLPITSTIWQKVGKWYVIQKLREIS